MSKDKATEKAAYSTLFDGDAQYLFRQGVITGSTVSSPSQTKNDQGSNSDLAPLHDNLIVR